MSDSKHGIVKRILSRRKDIDDMVEDLKDAQIALDAVEIYEDIKEKYEKNVKAEEKINKIAEKADEKLHKEEKRIEHVKKEMEKLEEKSHTYLIPFTKDHKRYKNLKKRLKRSKARRKLAEQAAKDADRQGKKIHRSTQDAKKALKRNEKALRKLWNEHAYDVKLVKIFNENKLFLQTIYDKESMKIIEGCIEKLKTEQELPENFNKTTKQLYTEIKRAKRFGRLRGSDKQISIIKEAKSEGKLIEDVLKEVEVKKEEKQEVVAQQEEQQQTQENEPEVAVQEEQQQVQENEPEVVAQEEQQESQENESEVEEPKEETEQKKLFRSLRNSSRKPILKDDEEVQEPQPKRKENKFQESLRENTYFVGSNVDRDLVEKVLRQGKIKGIEKLQTPEQLVAYLGRKESLGDSEYSCEQFLQDEKNIDPNVLKEYGKDGVCLLGEALEGEENSSELAEKIMELYKEDDDKQNVGEKPITITMHRNEAANNAQAR